jgi:hypothetical protein
MIEANVFLAEPPRDGQWVLSWKTESMPAPFLEFYETREAALVQATALTALGKRNELPVFYDKEAHIRIRSKNFRTEV